jgi:hypothetical protein
MGQSKKKRMCPALGREIASAECGAGRNTRLACPPACPHNPFSPDNYAQALAIEDGLTPKVLRRLAAELGSAYPVPAGRTPEDPDFFVRSIQARFFDRDVTGRTFAERWQAAGYTGLTNDERVIFDGQRQMHLMLLELHRIEPEQCEAQDRLDPAAAPLLILDRSLAGLAVRFASLLVWAYPQPQYWRLHGVASVIPECPGLEPEEVVRAVVRHLGGPVDMPALREWLQANFALMHRALGALAEGFRQRAFERMAVSSHSAVYRLRTPAAELARRFAALPALVPEPLPAKERKEGYTQGWVWLDGTADTKLDGFAGVPTLGNLALGPEHLCLKGGMGQRFTQLRAAFERAFGQDVELVGERTDDVARQFAQKHPPQGDPALVPPELLALAPQYAMNVSLVRLPVQGVSDPGALELQMARNMVSTYADQPVPALDGRTPREAARDPLLRPRLVTLMKRLVRQHDETCQRLGEQVDINGLLRALGLTELDFPPPPITPLPDEDMEEAFDEAQEDFAPDLEDDVRSPAPPLPAAPLTDEEINARIEHVLDVLPDPIDMIDECDADSEGLIDYAEAFAEGWHEQERQTLLMSVATVWYLFFPPEYEPPPLDLDLLDEAVTKNLDRLHALDDTTKTSVTTLLHSAAQPAVFTTVASLLVGTDSERKSLGIERQWARLEAMVFLRTLVDVIDAIAH